MQVIDILAPHKTLFALLASCCLCLLFQASCTDLSKEDVEQVNEALADSITSTTETWDVNMELIEEGEKKIVLTGSYAATYSTKQVNETHIQGPVHIDVFDSAGVITTRVDSDRAVYRAEQSEFELFGNVRVNTSDDRHLESEYLRWDQGSNRISTPEFVIITTPTDSIAGTGFNGTTDLSTYTIKQPKGRVIVD